MSTALIDAPASGYAPADGAALQLGNGVTAIRESPVAAPPVPIPTPLSIPRRLASGRYRSLPIGFQLELRVDIDGHRPLRRLSGDYYSVSGTTISYFGSWTVDAVTVTTLPSAVVVVGTARTTWSTTFTVARVTIPRSTTFQPPAPATIQWSTPSGAQGTSYLCSWESGAFRTVEIEQDRESGVTQFASYNTGSLPSGGPAHAECRRRLRGGRHSGARHRCRQCHRDPDRREME